MASNLFVSVNARREQPTEVVVPVLNTADCQWNKERRTLVYEGARFPEYIDVVSHHTGVVHRFEKDHEKAEQCEWWDGEMFEYKSTETDIRLIIM